VPEATSKSTNDGGGVQALSAQGKRVYLAHCTSCHNSDPGKDGVMGPAVAGSSLELVRTRVLEGGYPPGYKPKRDTKVMAALPHLKGDIEALTAYLNAP
jgi:mono/diheme cytochrome c family protein